MEQSINDRLHKIEKRLDDLEKRLIPLLESLDQKNYKLWKAKLKAEEKLLKRS